MMHVKKITEIERPVKGKLSLNSQSALRGVPRQKDVW